MTVKAEDRPSGLAGDSASVITFLFRLQPGLVEWRVLVAAARSGAALVSRQAHATVANGFKIQFICPLFRPYSLEKNKFICYNYSVRLYI